MQLWKATAVKNYNEGKRKITPENLCHAFF